MATHNIHPPYRGDLIRTLLKLERINTEFDTIRNSRRTEDVFGNPFLFDQKRSVYYSAGKDGVDSYGEKDDITNSKKKYTCEDYSMNCPRTTREILGIVSFISAMVCLVVITLGIFIRKFRKNET